MTYYETLDTNIADLAEDSQDLLNALEESRKTVGAYVAAGMVPGDEMGAALRDLENVAYQAKYLRLVAESIERETRGAYLEAGGNVNVIERILN